MSILARSKVPASRVLVETDAAVRSDAAYVLHWMTSARRTRWNWALERSLEWARELGRPLVVLEGLRAGYPHASDRMHRFVLDGMRDNRDAFEGAPVLYHPYVEARAGDGRGLLAALSQEACVVVTDDHPLSWLDAMTRSAARRSPVRFERVDGNGLLPMRSLGRSFARAHDFRRALHKNLWQHLDSVPKAKPLSRVRLPQAAPLPSSVLERWPAASERLLGGSQEALAQLAIDHSVAVVERKGGADAGAVELASFMRRRLDNYLEERNSPGLRATSELSAYLHFGHVGAHQVFAPIAAREEWTRDDLGVVQDGRREGWWGMSAAAEAFLDQLVTWRELGFAACLHGPPPESYAGLPEWARATLEAHGSDRRPQTYTREEFDQARTHDELWNAAQHQLREEGRIHNYLRMLWGKKILHWSPSPREAFETMVHLNDRYALDGRDPNSYSGIGWVLGRYDRAWGPEREVFGKVRYMTSDNTRRKHDVKPYLARWAKPEPGTLFS